MKIIANIVLFLGLMTMFGHSAAIAGKKGPSCSLYFSDSVSQFDFISDFYFPNRRRHREVSMDHKEFSEMVRGSFRELDPLYLDLKEGDLVLLYSGETVVFGMVYLGMNKALLRPPGSETFGTFTYGMVQFDLMDLFDPTTHTYRYYRRSKGLGLTGRRKSKSDSPNRDFMEALRGSEFGY